MITEQNLIDIGFTYSPGWFSKTECWNTSTHYFPGGFEDVLEIEYNIKSQTATTYSGGLSDATVYPNCKTVEQIQQLINMF